MGFGDSLDTFDFVSELYQRDAPETVLLPEYPSSNQPEAPYRNVDRWIIHDPFPPPALPLMQVLGPHHLMCGWGNRVPVTSTVKPPERLFAHWERVLGDAARPVWRPFDSHQTYTTIFPIASLPSRQQEIAPETLYPLHGKPAIAQIDCPQPEVLDEIVPPCVVKLSHGYAGLGNFFVRNERDRVAFQEKHRRHWPVAELFITRIIDNVTGDFGVQFYLDRGGQLSWIGFTHQVFDSTGKWSGARFSLADQDRRFASLAKFAHPVARYLHENGYYGVVGIDILENDRGERFLVDLNPRLTGVTPFLVVCRQWARSGDFPVARYVASTSFPGRMDALFQQAESEGEARIVVYSAIESSETGRTLCHLSVHARSSSTCDTIWQRLSGQGG